MPSPSELVHTEAHPSGKVLHSVRRFRIVVAEGPSQGVAWESSGDSCAIGTSELNDLVLEDPTVSRFHCEVRIDSGGARVRDLRSLNGTVLDGVAVESAFVRGGSLLRLGRTVVRFDLGDEQNAVAVSEHTRFGLLAGRSVAMRTAFAVLERAASSDVTILLEGETGTGKSAAAESVHLASARKDQPFLVVDCAAIPANLLESELFGHEKGAFTGADTRRIGAFQEADGGTIFLDEIGELPLTLQPKLLRVLERREVRRLGANTVHPVDVRVIAATNRDLRAEVNAGRFRPDLFFRLAVVRVGIPALREHPDDLPDLIDHFLISLRATPEQRERLLAPEQVTKLAAGAWPGNVRELRNYLERCLIFSDDLPHPEPATPDEPETAREPAVDTSIPFTEARRAVLDDFERRYLKKILRENEGKVAQAAAAAKLDRVYLYRLLRRHGLK